MKEKFKEEIVSEKTILNYLRKQKPSVFTYAELDKIFAKHSVAITFDGKIPTKSYLESLLERGKLKKVLFSFPSRKETRYLIGKVSTLAVAQSLKPEAYFTHRSAMYLHKLTDEFPETLYINVEQGRHHERDRMITQEGIDRAFKNQVRVSHEIAEYEGIKICVLHGQKTNRSEVIEKTFAADLLRVASVERTLIDIAVRPIYAGGVGEVINAYMKSKGLFSVRKLLKVLEEMDYGYPYHQAIGFYLETAEACSQIELNIFRKKEIKHDFYLTHKMNETSYSENWRLYYPKNVKKEVHLSS